MGQIPRGTGKSQPHHDLICRPLTIYSEYSRRKFALVELHFSSELAARRYSLVSYSDLPNMSCVASDSSSPDNSNIEGI